MLHIDIQELVAKPNRSTATSPLTGATLTSPTAGGGSSSPTAALLHPSGSSSKARVVIEPHLKRDLCCCTLAFWLFMFFWFYIPLVRWYGGIHGAGGEHDLSQSSTLLDVRSLCAPYNPCRHNAGCTVTAVAAGAGATVDPTNVGFTCDCPSGYSGILCERSESRAAAASPAQPAACGKGSGEQKVLPLLRHLLSDYTAENVWRHLLDQYVHIDPTEPASAALGFTKKVVVPPSSGHHSPAAGAASAGASTTTATTAPFAVEVGSANGVPSVYAAERGFQVLLMESGTDSFELTPSSAAASHDSDDDDDSGDGKHQKSYNRWSSSVARTTTGAFRYAMCALTLRQYEHHRSDRRWRSGSASDEHSTDSKATAAAAVASKSKHSKRRDQHESDDDDDNDDDDDDEHDKHKRKSKSSHDNKPSERAPASAATGPAGRIELIRALPSSVDGSEEFARLQSALLTQFQRDAKPNSGSSPAAAVTAAPPAGPLASRIPPAVALDDVLRSSGAEYVYVLKLNAPLLSATANAGGASGSGASGVAAASPASAMSGALNGLRSYLCEQRILYVLISGFWPTGINRMSGIGGGATRESGGDAATDLLQLLWDSGYTIYDLKLQHSTPLPTADDGLSGNSDAAKQSKRRHHSSHGHSATTDKLAAVFSARAALRTSNRRPISIPEYSPWMERIDRSDATAAVSLADRARGAVWTDLLAVANVDDLTPFVKR